jgi:hypothetical protein
MSYLMFLRKLFHVLVVLWFEVRECLLLFGAESCVFKVAIQKLNDQDI